MAQNIINKNLNKKDFIKIVCISDTHEQHNNLIIPDGDILIHCGDFTNRSDCKAIINFNNWLGSLPHSIKIIIAGNHDFTIGENCKMRELLTNCYYLQDSFVNINGYKIYGSPWVAKKKRHGFSVLNKDLEAIWEKIPEDTNILLTHSPPYSILDEYKNKHMGCEFLLKRIRQIKPIVHIFGHVHRGSAIYETNGTIFVNAAICDNEFVSNYNPIVFTLPYISKKNKVLSPFIYNE